MHTLIPPPFDATLEGTSGDDDITGTDLNELILGHGGDDDLDGGGGADSIAGGDGDDLIVGGSGDDTLSGQGGVDTIMGGSGNDFVYVHDLFTDEVHGGSGHDTLSFELSEVAIQFGQIPDGFENFIGSAFNDDLFGDAGRNIISGGDGDDVINGTVGSQGIPVGDVLSGGKGDDLIRAFSPDNKLSGGGGNDTMQAGSFSILRGGNGKDVIDGGDHSSIGGGSGNDNLSAGGDASTITGGDGDDRILVEFANGDRVAGGSGVDYFAFWLFSGAHDDLITDLEASEVIDLSAIDADLGQKRDQAFTLVSSLNGHAGEAALAYDPGTDRTSLLLDQNGDGTADITILLAGDQTGFTNFVL